jgi:hypothetical protein
MIEIALLFCFVAVLSALVGVIRGLAMIAGMVWRQIRTRPAQRNESDVR